MPRASLYSLAAVALSGCSLILDFSDSQIPKDAAPPDAFYTQAECSYDEPNDTFDTAASITTADMGPAAICPNGDATQDVDYYRFQVTTMATSGVAQVTITLTYQDRGPSSALDLALFDSTDSLIASENDSLTTKTITCPSSDGIACPMLGSASYAFEVSPATPGNINDYTFSLAIQ
ncbi:MAG TPA: hypothetical protein VH143_03900 [Kofleriaceae bacterium]|jgi:hypothetical protein|nr:hypothetical protein [Kofleriaceae bacterium]